MRQSDIVGAWTLVATAQRNEESADREPWGSFTRGLIVYSADGYMSAVLSSDNRTRFSLDDPRSGSTDEQSHAYATYMSYCGRYELSGDLIIHHVELSLFPNWIRTQQRRYLSMHGDVLRLSTPPMLRSGVRKIFELDWRRAG